MLNKLSPFQALFVGVMIISCNNSSDCIDDSKRHNGTCPAIYDPVCGCDNRTYGNNCEASRAGVTEFTDGECD